MEEERAMEVYGNKEDIKEAWKVVKHEVLQLAVYSTQVGVGIGLLSFMYFKQEAASPSVAMFALSNFGIGFSGIIRKYSKLKKYING